MVKRKKRKFEKEAEEIQNKNKADKPNNNKANDKAFAFLAVFLTILGFIIAILTKKENKYVMFYAKQGLVLFIGQIIIRVVAIIPPMKVIWAVWIILWVIGWVNALSGEMKKTPIISIFADKIRI